MFRLAICSFTGNGMSLRWRWGQCQAAASLGRGELQAIVRTVDT